MTRREVKQPLMSYRDAAGVWRHAMRGEGVDVDDDDLERFDAVNDPDAPSTTAGTPKAAPKKQAAKKAAPRK
jgi:hypothetical protein